MALRESSRVAKDKAIAALTELFTKRAALMSSSDIICEAHSIIKSVLNTGLYEQRTLEELANSTRSRKKKDPAVNAPAHKRVVGMFTPADSQAVADSFAEQERFFNATHLFVCFACKDAGISRRFAGWQWLKAHCKKDHGEEYPALTAAQEVDRKSKMQQQKIARATRGIAAADEMVEDPDVEEAVDPTEEWQIPDDGQWECLLMSQNRGERCGVIANGSPYPVGQHYWDKHPAFMRGGMHAHNMVTGEELEPYEGYEPLDAFTVRFLKAILPASVEEITEELFDDRLAFIQAYEGQRDDIAEAVYLFDKLLDDVIASEKEKTNVDADVPKVQRQRKCKTCGQPMLGHQKSKCRKPPSNMSLSPSPSKSRNAQSPQSPTTPQTAARSSPRFSPSSLSSLL
jgi:hypothetical protein